MRHFLNGEVAVGNRTEWCHPTYWRDTVLNADQMLARLYALRKDYADDPEDETYQALHHAFLFISYNVGGFKDYVKQEAEKPEAK